MSRICSVLPIMKYRDLGYKTRILKRKRHQHELRLKNEIGGRKLSPESTSIGSDGLEQVEFIDDNNAKLQVCSSSSMEFPGTSLAVFPITISTTVKHAVLDVSAF